MFVWVLHQYDGRIEGVYTTAGKAARDQQRFNEAFVMRERHIASINAEIKELRDLRQPYIIEAEMLLDTERKAKEANNIRSLKSTRKQRKVLLRQAEHLTYSIRCKEEKVLAVQRMTKTEILDAYGDENYWEEYCLLGEVD